MRLLGRILKTTSALWPYYLGIVLASMFETCAAAGERMYAWQIPSVRHTMRISAKYLEKGVFSEAAGPGSFIARMAANAIRSFFLIDPREDEQS